MLRFIMTTNMQDYFCSPFKPVEKTPAIMLHMYKQRANVFTIATLDLKNQAIVFIVVTSGTKRTGRQYGDIDKLHALVL